MFLNKFLSRKVIIFGTSVEGMFTLEILKQYNLYNYLLYLLQYGIPFYLQPVSSLIISIKIDTAEPEIPSAAKSVLLAGATRKQPRLSR